MVTGNTIDWIESGTFSLQNSLAMESRANIREMVTYSWILRLPDFDVRFSEFDRDTMTGSIWTP